MSKRLVADTDKSETLPAVQASDMLSVIAQAVSNPDLDVAKMQALLNMHMQITAQQQKVAFAEAMARLQAKLPQISKEGRIIVKGTERSRYARLEDLDTAIKPLMAEEGFSFSFDEDSSDGKLFKLSAKLSHKAGHSETKSITVPLDSSDYRTPIQSRGSTQSYAMRYLIKMHLSIVERDSDNDGNAVQTITEDQANDLNTLIADSGADQARFLSFMGVEKLSDILTRDFPKAMNALETKRRSQK